MTDKNKIISRKLKVGHHYFIKESEFHGYMLIQNIFKDKCRCQRSYAKDTTADFISTPSRKYSLEVIEKFLIFPSIEEIEEMHITALINI